MQQYDPLFGKELGNYLVQSKLGEGGMARVYKAYHARLRRDVAIKIITPTAHDQEEQAEFQARFEREAQVVASLEHRNIVAVYDFSTHEDMTYLVMQYVGGGTLRDLMRREHVMDSRRTANYMLQMARALHHAHQHGIVHRDVKPQNMLISATDPDYLLLSDFGIAKLFTGEMETIDINKIASVAQSSSSTLTSTGMFIGTAAYMAPEQVTRKPLDARTDVYALGVVLYQMLTGNLPFSADSQYGLMVQHVNSRPKPLREINPNIPEALAYITEKALQKEPVNRFQDAEEMARALEAALAVMNGAVNDVTVLSQFSLQSGFQTTSAGAASLPLLSGQPFNSSLTSHPTPATQFNTAHSLTPLPAQVQSGSNISRITGPSASPQSARRRQRKMSSHLYTLASVAIAIMAIVLLVKNLAPNLFSSITPPAANDFTGTITKGFDETFKDNGLEWTVSGSGASINISGSTCDLTSTDGNQHFPYPAEAKTGLLPASFTDTATMVAVNGKAQEFYGIAFRLNIQNTQIQDGYAFIVDPSGTYALMKYHNGSGSPLKSGTVSVNSLGQANTLQVKVADSTFSFFINGKQVLIGGAPSYTDTATPAITKGLSGLLISGNDLHIQVSHVKLEDSKVS